VIFVFEDYSLDTARRELRRGTNLVAVEPQVFDVLQYLVSQRERVVSKDDLIDAVWGGRIVSESTLSSRLTAVRHALGDCGEAQRLIRTIPRKGLRFVGEVREVGNACSIPTPQPATCALQLVASASEVPSDVREIDRNEFADEQHIKNIGPPVRVNRLKLGAAPTRYRFGPRQLRWLGAGIAVAILAVVLFAGAGFFWPKEPLQQAFPMPDRPALAVLAFNNVSGNPEQDYLADGLADDIITELARNRDLVVIARNSSFSFKGHDNSIPDIARRLGVRYVLDGSVRRSGEQVFFNAQLIDGHDARLVWAERYIFKTGDVYRVQEELVERVAGVLLSYVRETEKAASLRRPPNNLDVYELTLRGIAHKHQLNKAAYLQGRAELERAVALDPNFAPAHIYLGYLNGIDAIALLTGALSAADLPAAIAEIRRGIALDPNLPIGYQALGHHLRLTGQIEEALTALERAVALGPGDAENLIFLGAVQNSAGQHEQALATIERALALNPIAPVYYLSGYAGALYALDRFEDAHRVTADCLNKLPSYFPCRLRAAASLQALGRTREAAEHIAELLRQRPTSSVAEARAIGFPRDPPLNARFLEHLRAAGLPEEARH
jgi:TolB-like protein/DNA-binding winged helix-turn-helix (wHTH) protein